MQNHHQALTDIQAAVRAIRQQLDDHLAEGTMGIDRDDVEWLHVVQNLLVCADADLDIVIGRVKP